MLLSPVKNEMGTTECVLGWTRDPGEPVPSLFSTTREHLQQRVCGL